MPPQEVQNGEMTPLNGTTKYGSASVSFSEETKKEEAKPAAAGLVTRPLVKTRTSFWEDAANFHEGTVPHSIAHAVAIGVACGVSAWLYYTVLEALLEFLWQKLPEMFVVDKWPESTYVLWIPLMGFIMSLCVGLSVYVLGEPGDLPYTIKCVHDHGYIEIDHVLPMLAASQFSIIGGGSLGPEAPLVAICAAIGGWVSRSVFGNINRNTVRKHTLMGMAGALAAFFGCPLGGSLFALEVNSRFGPEYFEHIVESIFCGEVTLVVFRGLAGLPIDSIWVITDMRLPAATFKDVLIGCVLGLCGALVAFIFSTFHWKVVDFFKTYDLMRNERAVPRGLVGGVVIIALGMMIPHTLFWGEYEFQTISNRAPASTLEHVWPTSGLFGFEMTNGWMCLLVGVGKLIAISFTVAGGYRGGFIFPFFATGAALGQAMSSFLPSWIPVQYTTLCMAAGINVAITRTSLATSVILVFLSGEPNAMSAVLMASLTSLFATGYMPFIKSQIVRMDIDFSLYHEEEQKKIHTAEHSESQPKSADVEAPSDTKEAVVVERAAPTTAKNTTAAGTTKATTTGTRKARRVFRVKKTTSQGA